MGSKLSCCGSHASSDHRYPWSDEMKSQPKSRRKRRQARKGGEENQILKLLVEVNTLSSDDGPLRWEPFFHSLVPLTLYCTEEGKVYVYQVSATGVDGTSFSANIRVPGTKLRKTAECFIQWRDIAKGGAWGLNFMSESDALKFLEGCSPPTLTPGSEQLRHALSTLSLSLPIPNPPTAHNLEDGSHSNTKSHSSTNTGLDSVLIQTFPSTSEEVCHRMIDTSTPEQIQPENGHTTQPTSPSGVGNISELERLPTPDISYAPILAMDQSPGEAQTYSPPPEFHDRDAEEGKELFAHEEIGVNPSHNTGLQPHEANQRSLQLEEEDSFERGEEDSTSGTDEPELFEPSSPLHMGKNFILPDIIEENEGEELEDEYHGDGIPERQQGTIWAEDGTGWMSGQQRRELVDSGASTRFGFHYGMSPMDVNFQEAGLEGFECVETSFSENEPLARELRHMNVSIREGRMALSPVHELAEEYPSRVELREEEEGLTSEPQSPTSLTVPPSLPLSPPPGPVLSPTEDPKPNSRFPIPHSHSSRDFRAGSSSSVPHSHSSVDFRPHSTSPLPYSHSERDLMISPDTRSLTPHSNYSPMSSSSNRLSTISLSDETPPPLPTSLPPGKLISPRHSMLVNPEMSFEGLGIATSSSETGFLNLDRLTAQIASLKQEVEHREECRMDPEVNAGRKEENGKAEKDGEQSIEEQSIAVPKHVKEDNGLLGITTPEQRESTAAVNESTIGSEQQEEIEDLDVLPPPNDITDEDLIDGLPKKGSKLKYTPSFLQNLEPPVEFSDSGFTDVENTPPTIVVSRYRNHDKSKTKDSKQTSKEHSDAQVEENSNIPPHKASSTATSYSDDRLTEYSGSVGLKTNASSGSLPSLTTGSHELEDEGSSSMGTEVGDGGRGEEHKQQTDTPRPDKPSIRKTGWLEVKGMLVRKNRKVAMASKRRWKKYWATLKGSSLLLSQYDDVTTLTENTHTDLRLDLELSLVHAVHDHVKRDNIFCLSTSNGNTYYMQSTSQAEVEDWITTIHGAAATMLTKQLNKEEALKVLKQKAESINKMIEKEGQLRNLTRLNLSAVTDYPSRSMATKQLVACAENIEKYHVELYRFRCYMASLQGTELPNPQSLLGCVSKPTKAALGRVGIFTVASLHAIVSAREGSGPSGGGGFSSMRLGRGKPSSPVSTKGKSPKHKGSSRSRTPEKSKRSLEISGPYPLCPLSPSSTIPSLALRHLSETELETTDAEEYIEVPADKPVWPAGFINVLQVKMPSNQSVQVAVRNDMTVRDILLISCEKLHLNVKDYFLRLKLEKEDGEFECEVPYENELFVDLLYSHVEVCQKFIHTVLLSTPKGEEGEGNRGFGLTLEPEWDRSSSGLKSVCVWRVEEGGVGESQGVNEGDEVVLINDRSVLELGWEGISAAMQASLVSLTLRTFHIEMPISDMSSNRIMESLICPAPPSQSELSRETLSRLIVPMPSLEDLSRLPGNGELGAEALSRDHIDTLLKDSHELSKLLRGWRIQALQEETLEPWTREDRLRKSAQDLIETEVEYIRVLDLLIERYLEPLKSETFISQEEMETLLGNIPEIVQFQKKFLKSLEDALEMEMDSSQVPPGESPLKHVMFGIAGTFLYYVDHFCLYSTFCASHHKMKGILAHRDNAQLQQFLAARNPKKDPSFNLDSFLAKPIVRVSRYPLYLNAMLEYTQPDSDERMHLQDALEGMVRVADHINEMQRISETYSTLFDSMLRDSSLTEFGVSVSISQLRYHGQVLWLNPAEEQLAKGWKKGQGPPTLCFVFNSAIVLLCLDKKFKRRGSKPSREISVTVEDARYKALLPCIWCGVHDLPDSDGVTNMWQLRHKNKPGSAPVSYILRSQSIEQKSTMVHLVRQSIQEQQQLYGTPSGRATPTSSYMGRSSSSLTNLHSSPSHPGLRRVISPTLSHLSMATGYCTTSDTDHD